MCFKLSCGASEKTNSNRNSRLDLGSFNLNLYTIMCFNQRYKNNEF